MPHLTEHTGRSRVSWLVLPLIILLAVLLPLPGMAFPIYQSATLGPTGQTGGYSVVYDQILGVRFYVDKRVTTGSIGGYFSEFQPGLDSDIVGAIVRLHGAYDFPNSFDLTTRDVLGTTVIHVSDQSGDFAGNLELTLRRGWYALVFAPGGAGQAFEAQMPTVNTDIGDPSYFFGRPNSCREEGVRVSRRRPGRSSDVRRHRSGRPGPRTRHAAPPRLRPDRTGWRRLEAESPAIAARYRAAITTSVGGSPRRSSCFRARRPARRGSAPRRSCGRFGAKKDRGRIPDAQRDNRASKIRPVSMTLPEVETANRPIGREKNGRPFPTAGC